MNYVFLGDEWLGAQSGVFHNLSQKLLVQNPQTKYNFSFMLYHELDSHIAYQKHIKEVIGKNPDVLFISLGLYDWQNHHTIPLDLYRELCEKLHCPVIFIPASTFVYPQWQTEAIKWEKDLLDHFPKHPFHFFDTSSIMKSFWEDHKNSENKLRSLHREDGSLTPLGQELLSHHLQILLQKL